MYLSDKGLKRKHFYKRCRVLKTIFQINPRERKLSPQAKLQKQLMWVRYRSVGVVKSYGLEDPDSNHCWGEIFRILPGRLWDSPTLL